MEITFQTEIKETKGALNTAAKIAEILKSAEVTFGISESGQPAIWAKIDGKNHWIARYYTGHEADCWSEEYWTGSQKWATVYSKRKHAYQEEPYIFEHLTIAAEKLVDQWIMGLCDEYYKRILADA